MARKLNGFLRWVLLTANMTVCIAWLAACLIPFVNPGQMWFIAFLGLGFPILFFMMLILLLISVLHHSRWWMVFIPVLLLGFQQIQAVFAFHFPHEFTIVKQPGTLRVMQWNVHNWQQIHFSDPAPANNITQQKMMKLIASRNPDVLCVEEFFESLDTPRLVSSVRSLDSMGFTHHYFHRGGLQEGSYYAGVAIFSKYSIADSGTVQFTSSEYTDPLIYTDLQVGSQKIRVMACHLQSVRFAPSDYTSLSELRNAKESGFKGSRTIAAKLKHAYKKRFEQAQIVHEKIAQSPYPVILCGDFNDVPNSHTYFTIKNGLQDTFLKKGSFLGRTFRRISPTLRIDYILADKRFKINQFSVIHVPYSDHFPVISDLSFGQGL